MLGAAVNGRDIAAIGFDPRESVLEVQFGTGSVYQYFGVAWPVWEALMAAPLRGRAFSQLVRDQYQYQQIA